MTWSAPAARTASALRGLAVAMTWAPRRFASWTAYLPTTPPAPTTRRRCPACRAAVVDEGLPRRQGHGRQGRGVGQGDARRGGDESVGRGDDELGGASVAFHRQEADDLVADAQALDAVAERLDRARDVVAGHVGERHRDGEEPAPHARVGGVVGGCCHADEHLSRRGGGLLDLDVLEDLGSADLVETHCLHDVLLSSMCFEFEATP